MSSLPAKPAAHGPSGGRGTGSPSSSSAQAPDSGVKAWVPDSEVNECPTCSRKFGTTLRKHHCRACGRVVCGYCSGNQLFLPSHGKDQRVCDPCFDLLRHDKTASLTESLSKNRQVEASLKADLKEKLQQADWFHGFLLKVSAKAVPSCSPPPIPTPTPSAASGAAPAPELRTPELRSRDDEEEEGGPPEEEKESAPSDDEGDSPDCPRALSTGDAAEVICTARQRWRQACGELSAQTEETDRLRLESEALERECQETADAVKELKKAVRSMESDVKSLRPQVEVHRDQLSRKTDALREELEGLTQRMHALEAQLPARATESFLSSGSFLSVGGSFVGQGSPLGARLRLEGCANRFREGCSLM
ncbi:unnamed protein product [Polarella glacialis]|uniref:FYVE-type domain-containing protein n=3 Tax=Polarella glacialis TaxID=89957 RepID=A0A813EX05_POLGL|nr:unnamed protein product [Polarella glacialis]